MINDNYPQETSWKLYDEGANQIVNTGSLQGGMDFYSEDICIDYSSCFTYIFMILMAMEFAVAMERGFCVLDSNGNVILPILENLNMKYKKYFVPMEQVVL